MIKREILAPGIISYDNVGKNISNMVPEWEQHINNGSLNWSPSYVGENENMPEVRSVNSIGISNEDTSNIILNNIRKELDNAYQAYINDYCERYHTNNIGSDAYHILKYEKGHHYKAHHDWARGDMFDKRTFSLLHYLNDDFEGGELNFIEFGLKIKPKKNQLIIFPAHFPYAHQVEPVLSGERWTITKFLY
jgi:hypothetical protein